MAEPTREQLLAIAEVAITAPLSDYAKANIETTAQAIVDGDAPVASEAKNLELIKMLILTNHRIGELKQQKA